VRWAFEETGTPYEWIVLDETTGHSAEHARRHPLGRVPVLETDDGMLYESEALCLHVADLNPDANLMIRTLQARRGGDAGATEVAEIRLANAFAALGRAVDGNDYVNGGDFTIADVIVGGVASSAREHDVLPEIPSILPYLERLDARPARQRAYDS
jgi:glutathione S-transferase